MGAAHSTCGAGAAEPSPQFEVGHHSYRQGGGCGQFIKEGTSGRPEFLRGDFLEGLLLKLFCLHDLNCNGLLEELELVWLNEKIAVLHHGHDIDLAKIKAKYSGLFRSKLDRNGYAVPYTTFRDYTLTCLDLLDPHEQAQEMIMEQFVAEADMVRHVFGLPGLFCSDGDEDMAFPEGELAVGSALGLLEQHKPRCPDDMDPNEEACHEKPRVFLTHHQGMTASGHHRLGEARPRTKVVI